MRKKMMMRNIGYNYIVVIIMTRFVTWCVGNMQQELELFWGEGRARILGNNYGHQFVTLSLDKHSGSGFRSRHEFLFGKIDMKLKLIPGNSAGTVTAYYLSSEGSAHDEIDFEFLGNLSGEPYTVHTNIFTQGIGNREEQFHLWFDPTTNFHTYSIIWNPQTIILSVDGIAIREFKNMESRGIGFPNKQAMRVYSSLWNADDWATRGGLVKTNWTQAPFTAIYTAFNAHQACISTSSSYSYSFFSCSSQYNPWLTYSLDAIGRASLSWVRTNYMIYNYCTDTRRFPQALPPECSFS